MKPARIVDKFTEKPIARPTLLSNGTKMRRLPFLSRTEVRIVLLILIGLGIYVATMLTMLFALPT